LVSDAVVLALQLERDAPGREARALSPESVIAWICADSPSVPPMLLTRLRIVSSFCGSCVRAVTVKAAQEVEAQLLVVRSQAKRIRPSVMITTEMGIRDLGPAHEVDAAVSRAP